MSDPVASAAFIRLLARAADVSFESACADAGLAPSVAEAGSIAYADSVKIWEALARRLEDPHVGHRLGASITLLHAGVFGPAFAHARDLGGGLDMLASLLSSALPQGALTVTRGDGEGWVATYHRPAIAERTRHGVEALFAAIVSLAREATGRGDIVERVELETEPPEDPARYDAHYGGPVRFGAERTRLCIGPDALATPMIGHEPALAALMADHAPRLLQAETFESRVASACSEALRAGDPSAAETARRLGVSARTLHRRLKQAGLRFREVLDGVSREYAIVLLDDPSRSVDEVAEAVGYGSRAAFDRAFRRWRGISPAEHRRAGAR